MDPASHLPIDCFASRDLPLKEQWFYYFISDIILANSLLRADERVDADRIGLTGISWGGLGVSTALCYDDRFAFAAPVYGGGFMQASTSPWGKFGGPGVDDIWDAQTLLPEVRMPVMWFNGDNDPFFSANCATACAAATQNGGITLVRNLTHGMDQGIDLPEILRFANEQTGMGPGNIHITDVTCDAEKAEARFILPADVSDAELCVYYKQTPLDYAALYTGGNNKDCPDLIEQWRRKAGETRGDAGTVSIPAGTQLFYLSVEGRADGRTVRATTGIFEAKKTLLFAQKKHENDMLRMQQGMYRRFREMNAQARKGQTVFAGSSLMEMFPIEKFVAEDQLPVTVYNRGIGGTVTINLLNHIDVCILDLAPSRLFLNIGTNDLSIPETTIEKLMVLYGKVLDQVKARLPDCRIYLMAYYPINYEAAPEGTKPCLRIHTNEKLLRANEAVRRLAAEKGARFINVNAPITDENGSLKAEYSIDGLHFTEEGYRSIYPLIKQYLTE